MVRPGRDCNFSSRITSGEKKCSATVLLVSTLAKCGSSDVGSTCTPIRSTAGGVLDAGAEPVIPPRRHRRRPLAYDTALYKERNRIERFFSRLKQFRRVATRYDKLLANFRGFVQIAAIAILLA